MTVCRVEYPLYFFILAVFERASVLEVEIYSNWDQKFGMTVSKLVDGSVENTEIYKI